MELLQLNKRRFIPIRVNRSYINSALLSYQRSYIINSTPSDLNLRALFYVSNIIYRLTDKVEM